MPARKKKKADAPIYQIKVTLEGTKPPIWRRIQVPSNFSLADLHDVLQIVMGWQDCHLHQFIINNKYYGVPAPDMDWTEVVDESRAVLGKVVPTEKSKFRYEYDFGDSWYHILVVEKILPPEPGVYYPRCIKGKGNCPPEDCGGVWGYYALLETLANPKAPDHDDMLEWVGGEFDPEAFDPDAINLELGG